MVQLCLTLFVPKEMGDERDIKEDRQADMLACMAELSGIYAARLRVSGRENVEKMVPMTEHGKECVLADQIKPGRKSNAFC